jgi:iron only hydrogenase large subunit-like protein
MEVFYPDLVDHLPIAKSPEYNFKAFGKEQFPRFLSADKSKTTFVSIMPCIAKKFAASSDNEEIVLTARELARMIRLAGIDLPVLHESGFTPSFDNKMEYSYVTKAGQMNTEAVLWKVYEAYDCEKKTADFMDGGIKEIELISGTKALIVNGFANARTIMERIRKGKCDAALVGIMACPGGCGSPNTSISGA